MKPIDSTNKEESPCPFCSGSYTAGSSFTPELTSYYCRVVSSGGVSSYADEYCRMSDAKACVIFNIGVNRGS